MEIKTGVPIPEGDTPRRRKYPFNELAVGDAIEFEDTANFEKARRAALSYGKTHDITFTARKGIQDGEYVGEGGTIWRKS